MAILSVSAGAGHVRAAEAVRLAAEAAGHEASHLDLMTMVPRLFKKLYADSYLDLVNRHPALWGFLYHSSDAAKPDSKFERFRKAIERLNLRGFLRKLQESRPDVVVCTHFLPAQALSRATADDGFPAPVWVVVTDFDVHALWAHQGLAGYCVAADEIAARVRERGIGGARVEVTGIPIMPVFAAPPRRQECAAGLGIDPGRRTILLMSGGFGVGALDALAGRILGLPGDFQVLALAGRNEDLLARLRALAAQHPGRLLASGFTDKPERFMACADLVVSKPGGLSTSECLAMGKPMLAVSPIPGQEERNADHLLEHGAGLKAHDAAGVEYRVRRCLTEPDLLPRLAANAGRLGRAGAAARVVELATGKA